MWVRAALSCLSPAGASARLSILIFHRVLPEVDPLFPHEPDRARFDQILGWLQRWFDVLPLDEAVRRLEERRLPARAAAITFDDGYADNAEQALPLLRRHGLTATFFVATGFLDGGRMWNDEVIEALRHSRAERVDLCSLGLGVFALDTPAARRRCIDTVLAAIKYLEPAQRAQAVADVVAVAGASPRRALMMSSAQVRELHRAGMQVGAHTCTHPILARCADAQAAAEIADSKHALETLLQAPVPLFAYPNGKLGHDYDARHVRMARDAGFAAAVSTAPGAASQASDRFQLPRFSPWDRTRLRYGARLVGNLLTGAPARA